MTLVVVHTERQSDHFVTRWQCGSRSGDVVSPPIQCSNPPLAAELLALAHLLVEKSAVGNDKGTKPVTFHVSNTELPSAITQPRAHGVDIRMYSRALRARFADASFKAATVERPELLVGSDRMELSSGKPIDWTLSIADMPKVILTEHAVRRVQERHNFANLGYAFRHIRRWAKRELRESRLSEAARAEKLLCHASTGRILCDDTGWHGVVVNNTLVTMFIRKS